MIGADIDGGLVAGAKPRQQSQLRLARSRMQVGTQPQQARKSAGQCSSVRFRCAFSAIGSSPMRGQNAPGSTRRSTSVVPTAP